MIDNFSLVAGKHERNTCLRVRAMNKMVLISSYRKARSCWSNFDNQYSNISEHNFQPLQVHIVPEQKK